MIFTKLGAPKGRENGIKNQRSSCFFGVFCTVCWSMHFLLHFEALFGCFGDGFALFFVSFRFVVETYFFLVMRSSVLASNFEGIGGLLGEVSEI